ncbi:hypothetical protein D3C78_754520 [compost metagenome]
MCAFDYTRLELLLADQLAGKLPWSDRSRSQMSSGYQSIAKMATLNHSISQFGAADFTIGYYIARYRCIS